MAAEGTVTPAAEAEFAKSGDDPRARFYGAEAALQRGDAATAQTASSSCCFPAKKTGDCQTDFASPWVAYSDRSNLMDRRPRMASVMITGIHAAGGLVDLPHDVELVQEGGTVSVRAASA